MCVSGFSPQTETIRTLQEQLATLQAGAGASQSEDAATIARLQSELTTLRSSGSEASGQVSSLQSQLQEWESKHQQQTTRADGLEKGMLRVCWFGTAVLVLLIV